MGTESRFFLIAFPTSDSLILVTFSVKYCTIGSWSVSATISKKKES